MKVLSSKVLFIEALITKMIQENMIKEVIEKSEKKLKKILNNNNKFIHSCDID